MLTQARSHCSIEVIEEFGELSEGEGGLVERVVGFYEGLADLRSTIAAAKLQNRGVTPQEVSSVQDSLRSRAQFALSLSTRLKDLSDS